MQINSIYFIHLQEWQTSEKQIDMTTDRPYSNSSWSTYIKFLQNYSEVWSKGPVKSAQNRVEKKRKSNSREFLSAVSYEFISRIPLCDCTCMSSSRWYALERQNQACLLPSRRPANSRQKKKIKSPQIIAKFHFVNIIPSFKPIISLCFKDFFEGVLGIWMLTICSYSSWFCEPIDLDASQ